MHRTKWDISNAKLNSLEERGAKVSIRKCGFSEQQQ